MTPTQRSKRLMESQGYLVAITERWNPFAHIRQDLFGFIDLLAIRGDETLAIQTTSGSNAAARVTKIRGLQAHALWLESPNRKIVVHGWRKLAATRKWECRIVPITNEP